MWALVKDGNVIELYNRPKSVIINNVRYPSNMFTLYTEVEKKRIDIYDVKLKGNIDTRFHKKQQSSFSYDSEKEIVIEDFNIKDKVLEDTESTDKDNHGNLIIIDGLKTQYQNQCKSTAHNLIKSYQWLVERFVYDNTKTIPSDVSTYVENVRSSCEIICTTIGNCSDLDVFKVLFEDTYNETGEVTKRAVVHDWPDNYYIRKYQR